jgi:hypothetical protein
LWSARPIKGEWVWRDESGLDLERINSLLLHTKQRCSAGSTLDWRKADSFWTQDLTPLKQAESQPTFLHRTNEGAPGRWISRRSDWLYEMKLAEFPLSFRTRTLESPEPSVSAAISTSTRVSFSSLRGNCRIASWNCYREYSLRSCSCDGAPPQRPLVVINCDVQKPSNSALIIRHSREQYSRHLDDSGSCSPHACGNTFSDRAYSCRLIPFLGNYLLHHRLEPTVLEELAKHSQPKMETSHCAEVTRTISQR